MTDASRDRATSPPRFPPEVLLVDLMRRVRDRELTPERAVALFLGDGESVER